MKVASSITFHGTCDRYGCKTPHKNPHSHKVTDPTYISVGLTTPETRRPRFAYATLEGQHGRYTMCITVQELISRLQQLPPSAIISMESEFAECDLMAFDPAQHDKLWTILNNYVPQHEDFNYLNQILK